MFVLIFALKECGHQFDKLQEFWSYSARCHARYLKGPITILTSIFFDVTARRSRSRRFLGSNVVMSRDRDFLRGDENRLVVVGTGFDLNNILHSLSRNSHE